MTDELPRLLRAALIAALKAREDRIVDLAKKRTPVSRRGDDDPDSDLWWARHDGREFAESLQGVARQCGDVHLLGLTTMFLMEQDAVKKRETEEEQEFTTKSFAAEQSKREHFWKYGSDIKRLCDRYLDDPATELPLDRGALIAIIDENAARLSAEELNQLFKYIDRPERRLWLRDRMVESLRKKFPTGEPAPAVEDARAAASEQLPNLHNHMAKHLRNQIGRAIVGLPPKRDERQRSAVPQPVPAEVTGSPQDEQQHEHDSER